MRIVQIIDSLEIGGAEKMAVNYANSLSTRIDFSGLVTTRAEGKLKKQISDSVSYLYLNKKSTFDFGAILRLKKYCKVNKIDFLQAHGSSYFTAVLVKTIYPKIKIIWHDHNGLGDLISLKEKVALKITSCLFESIIVVNNNLKVWAEKELNCSKVRYLPNFTSFASFSEEKTFLYGIEGKRILCLANLRIQKNHFFLLEVAEKLNETNPDWTFHIVGKDFGDDYSLQIRNQIIENKLAKNVFVYGSKNDVINIVKQSDIAILTSLSEGLPVALLEYGLLKKPVVLTNVGEIPLIINDGINGFIVGIKEVDLFYERLLKLIGNKNLRIQMGNSLYNTIVENHSEEGVMTNYLNWVKSSST